MKQAIERIEKARIYLLSLIDHLTPEQMNEIPPSFNNNIIWNLGHLIASQQSICYLRSGNKMFIEEKYLSAYKPETKPNQFVDGIEIDQMKKLFLAEIDQLKRDYENDLFSNYIAFTSRYNIEVNNAEDALNFLLFHEALHIGYIMALKRLLTDSVSNELKTNSNLHG